MSLTHVDPKDRLTVSLGYLRAVRNRIAAGDIPTGQPLYPEDVVEFMDEILKANTVIEKQAAQIAELKSTNKDLDAKVKRDEAMAGIRASTVQNPNNTSASGDTDTRALVLQQANTRLGQLSDLLVTKQGEQHATTEEDEAGTATAGYDAPDGSSGVTQRFEDTVQVGGGTAKRGRKARAEPPPTDWDGFEG